MGILALNFLTIWEIRRIVGDERASLRSRCSICNSEPLRDPFSTLPSVCTWSMLHWPSCKTSTHPPKHEVTAAQINRKNNTTKGQKEVTVTLTAAWRCLTAGSRKPAVSEKEEGGAGGKGLNLPYRRYGGGISSPNLAEGTCLGASHTYRGTLCGRFPGGSRDEDYRRSEGRGCITTMSGGKKSEEKMGGGKDRNHC